MDKNWLNELPLSNIKKAVSVSGGDVNDAYRIETDKDTFFLLVQPNTDKSFYTAEIAGLNEFKKADVRSPAVIESGEIQNDAYLLLEYLEEGSGNQKDLGKLVAKLHQYHSKNKQFGFHEDYQGQDVSFDHEWTDSWVEIFIERRLDKMKELITQKNYWTGEQKENYKQAREMMIEELSTHKSGPSLLHGDLWAGNYMFLSDGQPALFDPAAFYGDREFDIGVSTVFGGFGEAFYKTYQKEYPLADGYEKRLDYYRLHMLMLHLIKFGETYAGSVDRTLKNIIQKA